MTTPNEERADHAQVAIDAHQAAMIEAGRTDDADRRVGLSDLLADLRHWSDRAGIAFAAADRLAEINYNEERAGGGR